MKERFPVLQLARIVLRLVAWLGAAIALVVGVGLDSQGRIPVAFLVWAGGVVVWLAGMIVPELIGVLLAIERNTRGAAEPEPEPEQVAD